MRFSLTLTLATTLITSAACSNNASDAPNAPTPAPSALTQLPRSLSNVEQQLVTGSNNFAFSLFRAVDSIAGPDSNVFISPLSASMALGMTTVGAAGSTLDSMRAVLGYNNIPIGQMADSYHSLITLLQSLDPSVDFQLTNAIWYDHTISVLPAFVSTAQSDFNAPVTSTDFTNAATADIINHWVDSSTNGKISSIVDPATLSSFIVFLANAVYFHGSWTQQFDPQQTRDTVFTTRTGATKAVQLMHLTTDARVSVTSRYTAVDLPYGRDAYTMTVIVPADGISLDSLIIALRNGEWSTLTSALDASSGSANVQIALPKFTLAWDHSLNAPLQSLGMGIAFSPAANFSNLTPTSTQISSVVQKTYVNVDEEGTTAAAVTGVGVIATAYTAPISVRADHPFIYVLRERLSNTILFVGAFAHPPTQ